MRGLWGFFAVATVLAAPAARAQDPEPDPAADAAAAVRLAKAAFEYRDFERVVDTLDPWLHPPRIVDDRLEVQARMLLGVSLHVLGKPQAAADEFALLLKLDPDHELDPFVVPPRVIQTFEEIRAKMKPALDAKRKERDDEDEGASEEGASPPEPRIETRVVRVPHPALALAPLGVPQFAADEPGWGVFWASLQVIGLAINVVAFAQPGFAQKGDAAYGRWLAAQYGGAVAAGAAWVGSAIHGYILLQELEEAPATDAVDAPPVASWRWSF